MPTIPTSTLSASERKKLAGELDLEAAHAIRPPLPLGKLTPRERLIRSLMLDRHHRDGCPIIDADLDDPATTVGRVEAYDVTRPADPRVPRGPMPVTTVRCIECGGDRVLEGTLVQNLRAALATSDDAAGADVTLS
jgi:hypothetical protein